MATNLLYCTLNTKMTYAVSFDTKSANISGALVTIMDKSFTGVLPSAVWNAIVETCGANDGIVYVIQWVRSSAALAYVGKTLNTIGKRYPNGPTGGLKLVWDKFNLATDIVNVTLYNVSHPCLIEGWCYQVATDLKLNLSNVQDPS